MSGASGLMRTAIVRRRDQAGVVLPLDELRHHDHGELRPHRLEQAAAVHALGAGARGHALELGDPELAQPAPAPAVVRRAASAASGGHIASR